MMGGIKPPPDWHRRLNKTFIKKAIIVNIIFIILLLFANYYLLLKYKGICE